MDSQQKRGFTQDEVTAIIRRALLMRGPDEAVDQEDLEDIARQSGISPERLRQAIEEEEAERALDDMKAKVRAHNRKEFGEHFRIYLIVNAALLLVNFFTSSYFWVIWVLLGWGIAVAIHASEVLFTNEADIEKKARKLLHKERQKAVWQEKLDWLGRNFCPDFRPNRKRDID